MNIEFLDVSIIIISWNTRNILRDCLRSLYEQTKNISFEVIVVDNASGDGSAEMVKAEFPEVLLILNSENRGFGAANNQGMHIAKGRYLLLLNSDTIILEGAIQKTVFYADQHRNVGVVGCRALFPDRTFQSTCFRFDSIPLVALSSFAFFRGLKPFRSAWMFPERYLTYNFDVEHDVDVVAGCFFLVRQEVIKQCGMFDEDFFMFGEEAELCERIHSSGWLVRYYPGADIVHLHGASAFQVKDDTQIYKRAGTLLFLYKTRGNLYTWIANLIMVIGLFMRMPCWIIIDLFGLALKKQHTFLLKKELNVLNFHLSCAVSLKFLLNYSKNAR